MTIPQTLCSAIVNVFHVSAPRTQLKATQLINRLITNTVNQSRTPIIPKKPFIFCPRDKEEWIKIIISEIKI